MWFLEVNHHNSYCLWDMKAKGIEMNSACTLAFKQHLMFSKSYRLQTLTLVLHTNTFEGVFHFSLLFEPSSPKLSAIKSGDFPFSYCITWLFQSLFCQKLKKELNIVLYSWEITVFMKSADICSLETCQWSLIDVKTTWSWCT